MRRLTGRQQAAVLLALVRNWPGCVRKWRVARIVLRAREVVSDERIRAAMHWLTVFDGNWSLAKGEVRCPRLVAWIDDRLHGRKGGAS